MAAPELAEVDTPISSKTGFPDFPNFDDEFSDDEEDLSFELDSVIKKQNFYNKTPGFGGGQIETFLGDFGGGNLDEMDDDSSNNLDDIDDIDDDIDVPGKMMMRNSFVDNDMNIAAPSMEEPTLDDANSWTLIVKNILGMTLRIKIDPEQTGLRLKEEVSKITHYSAWQQMLMFRGKRIKNDDKLNSHHITDGCKIHLVIKMTSTVDLLEGIQPVAAAPVRAR